MLNTAYSYKAIAKAVAESIIEGSLITYLAWTEWWWGWWWWWALGWVVVSIHMMPSIRDVRLWCSKQTLHWPVSQVHPYQYRVFIDILNSIHYLEINSCMKIMQYLIIYTFSLNTFYGMWSSSRRDFIRLDDNNIFIWKYIGIWTEIWDVIRGKGEKRRDRNMNEDGYKYRTKIIKEEKDRERDKKEL